MKRMKMSVWMLEIRKYARGISLAALSAVGLTLTAAGCGGGEGPIVPPPAVPAEYADKHMPEGWWTDQKIFDEGKEIYEGRKDIDVNCASCHGNEGKPKKRGARDFRVPERMKLFSDSYMFWRVSEGVSKTKMKAWKSKLSEEDRWKVIAYLHKFSHEGKPAPHDDYTPPSPSSGDAGS